MKTRQFTLAWLLLAGYILVIEFFAAFLAPDLDSLRVIAAIWGAVAETWALARRARGDTLSEHIWRFYASYPARIPLVSGFAVYICVALVSIPAPSEPMLFGLPLAPLSLAAGAGLWLVPHFLGRGKWG